MNGIVTLLEDLHLAIKPTLLRYFESLLQWLESNNEMTWLWCNSIIDYRSLIYFILDPSWSNIPLLLHKNIWSSFKFTHTLSFSINQYTCTFENHNLTLYLYHLDCQVSSIQIGMTNNYYHSQLEPLLEIIKLHMPK